MAVRQQPAPGERDHGSWEPRRPQLHREVDHAEAGAQDHHRPVRVEVLRDRRRPRVGDVSTAAALSPQKMAGRQNGACHRMPASTGQREPVALARRLQVDHLVWDDAQAQGAAVLAEGCRARATSDSGRRGPARQRCRTAVSWICLSRVRVGQLPAGALKPVHEVHRPVRIRAHVGGAHVQQVDGIGGWRKPRRARTRESVRTGAGCGTVDGRAGGAPRWFRCSPRRRSRSEDGGLSSGKPLRLDLTHRSVPIICSRGRRCR